MPGTKRNVKVSRFSHSETRSSGSGSTGPFAAAPGIGSTAGCASSGNTAKFVEQKLREMVSSDINVQEVQG